MNNAVDVFCKSAPHISTIPFSSLLFRHLLSMLLRGQFCRCHQYCFCSPTGLVDLCCLSLANCSLSFIPLLYTTWSLNFMFSSTIGCHTTGSFLSLLCCLPFIVGQLLLLFHYFHAVSAVNPLNERLVDDSHVSPSSTVATQLLINLSSSHLWSVLTAELGWYFIKRTAVVDGRIWLEIDAALWKHSVYSILCCLDLCHLFLCLAFLIDGRVFAGGCGSSSAQFPSVTRKDEINYNC